MTSGFSTAEEIAFHPAATPTGSARRGSKRGGQLRSQSRGQCRGQSLRFDGGVAHWSKSANPQSGFSAGGSPGPTVMEYEETYDFLGAHGGGGVNHPPPGSLAPPPTGNGAGHSGASMQSNGQ